MTKCEKYLKIVKSFKEGKHPDCKGVVSEDGRFSLFCRWCENEDPKDIKQLRRDWESITILDEMAKAMGTASWKVPSKANVTLTDLRPALHIGKRGGDAMSERTLVVDRQKKQKEVGRQLAKTLEEKGTLTKRDVKEAVAIVKGEPTPAEKEAIKEEAKVEKQIKTEEEIKKFSQRSLFISELETTLKTFESRMKQMGEEGLDSLVEKTREVYYRIVNLIQELEA